MTALYKDLRLFSLALTMLLLISCADSTKVVVAPNTAYEQQIYNRPVGIPAVGVKFAVIDAESEIPEGVALFGLTADDYLTFATWLEDVLRYINQQNALIDTYETQVRDNNASIAPQQTP